MHTKFQLRIENIVEITKCMNIVSTGIRYKNKTTVKLS